MGIVVVYLLGVAVGGFLMLLLDMLRGTKVVDDFIQELGVETADQVIATMSLLWPLTVVAGIILAVGYCLHSLYVVIRAVIATVKVKIKNA